MLGLVLGLKLRLDFDFELRLIFGLLFLFLFFEKLFGMVLDCSDLGLNIQIN